jgi:hypothetical protein
VTLRMMGITRIGLGAVAVVALAAAAVAAPAPQAAQAAPVQQSLTCKWQNIGTAQSDLFHGADVMDTDQNIAYWYGGVDATFATSDKVESADFSGATFSATVRPVSAGGASSLVGSAGAYRAKGAKADGSALYFFGGIKDPTTGISVSDVQRYVTKTGTWSKISIPTGSLTARVFAAAAYDPDHDVIWIIGGTSSCKLSDVLAGQACQARSLAIQYLTFDPATGEPKEMKTLGVNTTNFGHTAVYDSAKKRVLIFGGTGDIKSGRNTLSALDLTNPDPAQAKLANVTTAGIAPSIYFHGAAYDAVNNWMLVYGGVTQNFLQSNENTYTTTMALNLGATPNPTWTNLAPQGTPGDRVAGGLVYVPKHKGFAQILGRKKITFSSATPPAPQPSVQKTIQGLTCTMAATPTATTVRPTNTPGPSPTGGPTAAPTATAGPAIGSMCPGLDTMVPPAVVANALANPTGIQGWNTLCNPNLPPSPFNLLRTHLSLQSISKPYNPLFNSVIYKCGCP